MTLMTFRSETLASCEMIELDARGVVMGFLEKLANPPGNLANGAVYLLAAELFHTLATELRMVADFSIGTSATGWSNLHL